MWLLACWRTVETGVMLYNVFCARALAVLERKWKEGKLSLCHDWMHWWCDISTANKEVVMIGWCTSWCRKNSLVGEMSPSFPHYHHQDHFELFISSIISISQTTVGILFLQKVQNFSPKMHSEWLSFGIELPFISGQSFKETQTVFSYRICEYSQSNQETRYLSY